LIYLDYNATTPLDSHVFEAMAPYMTKNWRHPSSPYSFGNQTRLSVEKARKSVAENLGCKSAEIIFTSCVAESDNLAVREVAHALRSRGNHFVTTAIEHHAVLNTCKALEAADVALHISLSVPMALPELKMWRRVSVRKLFL
jgi:cysteine desulfurase